MSKVTLFLNWEVKELMQESFEVDFAYDFNNPPIARVAIGKLKISGENNV